MAPPFTGKSLIPHPPTEGENPQKRILCLLLLATLPFGSVLANAPKEKNAKVTLVYQHELPNVPGKRIKGVLVEYGPGSYSPGHTHPKSAFIYATVLVRVDLTPFPTPRDAGSCAGPFRRSGLYTLGARPSPSARALSHPTEE
jgi:hypothetical protein